MTSFAADWLALREPADAGARDDRLVARLAETLDRTRPVRILDLGAGSGANLRYLAPRLPMAQQWTLVDQDAALLAAASPPQGPVAVTVSQKRLDLSDGLSDLPFEAHDLVTASAFMDLVSQAWLDELGARCRRAGAALYLALTYDGRIAWAPSDPEDNRVRHLFNRHQGRDKGFGPALGPEAPAAMRGTLTAVGYKIECADSDWHLGADEEKLQETLLEGYAAAASEIAPDAGSEIAAWQDRRRASLANGRSRLRVGHVDLLALA